MIRCITIDDEPLALKLINQYISKIEDLTLVDSFDDALKGLEVVQQHPVDLLIIDINMPDINGLQLVERLGEPKPFVVFTTAYRDYAVEGFRLDAVDYLLKPVPFNLFEIAIGKVRRRLEQSSPQEFLVVHSEYKQIKIPLADITYIESLADYVKIFVTDQAHPTLTLNSLKMLETKLPGNSFSRIHRSYIVNHQHISAIRGKKVHLDSGEELPVGQRYDAFIDRWLHGS